MNKTLFITSLAWLSISTTVFAWWLALYSALPNTVDDTNLEYIEIQNASCSPITMGGYTLRDAAGSIFTLPEEVLVPGAIRRFMRSETRIALNNTDETLELRSPIGENLSTRSYTTSVKGMGINFSVSPYGSCTVETVIEETIVTHTASGVLTQSGVTQTGNGIMTDSGSIIGSGSIVQIGSGMTQLFSGAIQWGTGTLGVTSSGLIIEMSSGIAVGSWSIVIGTGGIMGMNSSGEVTQTGILTSNMSSPVMPLFLKIIDQDRNGRVDRLSVEYSGTLSGALRVDKLAIYSNTGGLSTSRIDSGSGVIRALSLSGAELIIDLHEQDLMRTDLRVNATTESHIRLKTFIDFGLTDLSWLPVQALTLTESFQKYAPAYIRNEAYTPVTNQSAISTSIPVVVIPLNSNSVSTGSITSIATPAILPTASSGAIYTPSIPEVSQMEGIPRNSLQLLPTIQIQSGILASGSCRTRSCVVNLRVGNARPGDRCEWSLTPAIGASMRMSNCNPGSMRFGMSWGSVWLTVIRSQESFAPIHVSVWAFVPKQSVSRSSKKWVSNPSFTEKALSVQTDLVSQKTQAVDIFEEYFEIMDKEDGENSSRLSKETVSKKWSSLTTKKEKQSLIKNSKDAISSSSKISKKASMNQPATTKTTKITKTTKVTKPPTPPKSIEKPQKNPAPSTTTWITPTTIGVVWLLCSALGFGVAIYRRRWS